MLLKPQLIGNSHPESISRITQEGSRHMDFEVPGEILQIEAASHRGSFGPAVVSGTVASRDKQELPIVVSVVQLRIRDKIEDRYRNPRYRPFR